jgi:hypothetical protein
LTIQLPLTVAASEHARARIDEAPDEGGSFERKEPAADLEAAGNVAQLRGERLGAGAALDVERD